MGQGLTLNLTMISIAFVGLLKISIQIELNLFIIGAKSIGCQLKN